MVCKYIIQFNNHLISLDYKYTGLISCLSGNNRKTDDTDDYRQTSNFFADYSKIKRNSENNRLYRLNHINTTTYRINPIAAGFSHIFPSSGGESTMPPSIMGSGAALH